MKLEVSAPAELAEIIAEFAFDGALVVWTRATSEEDGDLGIRTVIHLDGDVATTITPACLIHPGRDELFQLHDREIQKIGVLLRTRASQGMRMIAMVTVILSVVTTAAGIATGQSWYVFVAVGGVGTFATQLARRVGHQLLVRGARRAVTKHRERHGSCMEPITVARTRRQGSSSGVGRRWRRRAP